MTPAPSPPSLGSRRRLGSLDAAVSEALPRIRAVARPFVSVVMPVRDCASFLPEAIDSILAQTYPHFELIIVDNGSTDGSRDVADGYALRDRRVRTISRPEADVNGAMNAGVRLARGAWIARMDADDIAVRERLALSVAWAEQNGLDVCGGQAETFGGDGPALWFPEDHASICRELLFRCSMLYPSSMIRATVLRDNPHMAGSVFDDYELFTRLAPRYRLGNAPEVLVRYRRHERQSTLVRRLEFSRDFRRYRFRYFYAVHPQTPLAEYLPLARISDRGPLPTLTELEQAGRWLVRLARCPDPQVREAMAERWQKACQRSAALGDDVDTVFRRFEARLREDAEALERADAEALERPDGGGDGEQ